MVDNVIRSLSRHPILCNRLPEPTHCHSQSRSHRLAVLTCLPPLPLFSLSLVLSFVLIAFWSARNTSSNRTSPDSFSLSPQFSYRPPAAVREREESSPPVSSLIAIAVQWTNFASSCVSSGDELWGLRAATAATVAGATDATEVNDFCLANRTASVPTQRERVCVCMCFLFLAVSSSLSPFSFSSSSIIGLSHPRHNTQLLFTDPLSLTHTLTTALTFLSQHISTSTFDTSVHQSGTLFTRFPHFVSAQR